MEIQTFDEYFKNSVPNTNYWNYFIGSGKFDFEYLQEQFDLSHSKFNKKNQYLLILRSQQLIGITIYRKLKYVPIYKINLLAKKEHCQYKGIGRFVFNYLETNLQKGCLILIDDSGIPNYYSKLGFKKSWGGVNCLFGEFQSYSYYKFFFKKKKILNKINNLRMKNTF